jgi:branched-chain amino acid transport system permease protein
MIIRKAGAPSRTDERSSWQSAKDIRPIPAMMMRLPEVRWGVLGIRVAIVAAVLLLPFVFSESQINLATVIALYSIVGLSLVVLTGWAGQISLGQVAFFGIGAAVGSHITTALGWDLSVAIVVAGFAGALSAMIIGIPALRIRGLYLAVITLAFALATSAYLLNTEIMHWLPTGRFDRPNLFGRIALDTETRYYYFAIAGVLLTLAALRGLRNSRTGRVLIGIRENERAAQAFGVNAVTAKLTAFALSGFLAAGAGAMFVHHQQALTFQSYGVARSFQIFIEVVLGGLGSPLGALLGVGIIEGITYFKNAFPETIRLFLTFFTGAIGLMFVLLMLPGGLAEGVYLVRDRILRLLADRRGLMVPSLNADGRVVAEETPPSEHAVEGAAELLDDDMLIIDLDEEPEPRSTRRREPLRAGRS